MENIIRCPRCKDLYVFFGVIKDVSVCPECLLKDEEEYKIVRQYVKENTGCSINEVSDATKFSKRKIIKYIKEERLEIIGGNTFLKCEACGIPINTGALCQSCKKKGITVSSGRDDGMARIEFKNKLT